MRPLIVISTSCSALTLTEFLNKLENPPVKIILKDFLVSFLIKLIRLSINPAYPQKNQILQPKLCLFL